jgi:hypothetical protein
MSLDPYQLCPCGSGDKVKFCCSKDIIPELDKILRAVEGEQRVAALDQIEKLVADKGERLALLALKADLQLSLGGVEGAEKTIAAFQKGAPYNPVALSLSAIVAASKSDAEAACEKLQRSLEYLDKEMPQSVYAAIGLIGRLMLSRGDVLAARGHWILQANLAGGQDKEPIELLSRLNTAPEIPLLLKEDHSYADCPADVPWAGEFNAALKSAGRGAWLAATESLESLAAKIADQPALVKNMAIFRGWLGNTKEAVVAWHKYAAMDGVDQDDAVEAEALAQMLEDKPDDDEIVEVSVLFAIPDMDKLMEVLLAHRQFSKMSVDPRQLAEEEDQPPPKAVFWMLDRPIPETGVGLKREEIPSVVADILIYGKQTDRDARLELVLLKTDDFDDGKQVFKDLAGDLVGDITEEKTTGSVELIANALTWRWHLPNDTPNELRTELVDAEHREVMLEKWTTLPQKRLDEKSPVDVSGDETYRVRLLAMILLLEIAADTSSRDFNFDELRTKLGLPLRQLIPSKNLDILTLSMVKLMWIDAGELDDEQLYVAFQRAALKNQIRPIFRFGKEMMKRDQIPKELDKSELYETVIGASPTTEVALELVAEAKAMAVQENESPARWLLAELSVRLSRMESELCTRLVQTIQSHHMNEPGVADGLYRLLVNYGVISPDGTPAGGRPAPQQAAAPTPNAPEPGGLWTPDGPTTPAGNEPQKSKLWVPGMD